MVFHDKQALRKIFRERRLSLDASTRISATGAIINNLWEIINDVDARTICLYWPLIEQGEIDLRPLIRDLWDTDYEVSLPRVIEDGAPHMEATRIRSEDDLQPGLWGLMEPDGDTVNAEAIDLVVVPALAADLRRNRLGYGKGFYDAFLSSTTAISICAVFDICLTEKLPADPHDRSVDVVFTESRVIVSDNLSS